MAGKERGYKLIRRQQGKPDGVITFANTATLIDMVYACEEGGYKMVGHPEITETPEDADFIDTTIITVEPS